jgi:hypothetical protein
MNLALLILAQDSKIPAIRAKPGSSDLSQVLEVGDILRVRQATTGLIVYAGND